MGLSDLPDPIIGKIFELLSGTDRVSMLRTCKKIHENTYCKAIMKKPVSRSEVSKDQWLIYQIPKKHRIPFPFDIYIYESGMFIEDVECSRHIPITAIDLQILGR